MVVDDLFRLGDGDKQVLVECAYALYCSRSSKGMF